MEYIHLNFSLEEIDGEPRAVFNNVGQPGNVLLQHFLNPAPHYVPDVLYEISLVERHAVESSGVETQYVDVYLFRDRLEIEAKAQDNEESWPAQIVLTLDEAKLMLLGWGVMLQRWRMGLK